MAVASSFFDCVRLAIARHSLIGASLEYLLNESFYSNNTVTHL